MEIKSDLKQIKVALLLSGQPRFYNSKSYESIKTEILDKHDTDVFFHTWYKKDYKYDFAPWSDIKELSIPDNTPEELVKLYNPKMYQIEEPREFIFCETKPETKFAFCDLANPSLHPEFYLHGRTDISYMYKAVPSMIYSLSQASKLCSSYQEKNGKYDWIIRARFDTLISNLPNLTNLNLPNLTNGYFYVPDNCPNPEVFNDNFSITKDVKIYDFYDCLKDYISKVGIVPETILKHHLNLKGLKVCKLPKSFNQTFVREKN